MALLPCKYFFREHNRRTFWTIGGRILHRVCRRFVRTQKYPGDGAVWKVQTPDNWFIIKVIFLTFLLDCWTFFSKKIINQRTRFAVRKNKKIKDQFHVGTRFQRNAEISKRRRWYRRARTHENRKIIEQRFVFIYLYRLVEFQVESV